MRNSQPLKDELLNRAWITNTDDLGRYLEKLSTQKWGIDISSELRKYIIDAKRLWLTPEWITTWIHSLLEASFFLFETSGTDIYNIENIWSIRPSILPFLIEYTNNQVGPLVQNGTHNEKQLRAAYHLQLLWVNSPLDWFLHPDYFDTSETVQELEIFIQSILSEINLFTENPDRNRATLTLSKIDQLIIIVRIIWVAQDTNNTNFRSRAMVFELSQKIQELLSKLIEQQDFFIQCNEMMDDMSTLTYINLRYAFNAQVLNFIHYGRIEEHSGHYTELIEKIKKSNLSMEKVLEEKRVLLRKKITDPIELFEEEKALDNKMQDWKNVGKSNQAYLDGILIKKLLHNNDRTVYKTPLQELLKKKEIILANCGGFKRNSCLLSFNTSDEYIDYCIPLLEKAFRKESPIPLTEDEKDIIYWLLSPEILLSPINPEKSSKFLKTLNLAWMNFFGSEKTDIAINDIKELIWPQKTELTFTTPDEYLSHCSSILERTLSGKRINFLTENQKDLLRSLLIFSTETNSISIDKLTRFIWSLSLALKNNTIKELTIADVEIFAFAVEYFIHRWGWSTNIDFCVARIKDFIDSSTQKLSKLSSYPRLYLSLAKFDATRNENLSQEEIESILSSVDHYLQIAQGEIQIHLQKDFDIIKKRVWEWQARKYIPTGDVSNSAIENWWNELLEKFQWAQLEKQKANIEADKDTAIQVDPKEKHGFGTKQICDSLKDRLFWGAYKISVIEKINWQLSNRVEQSVTDFIDTSISISTAKTEFFDEREFVVVFKGSLLTQPLFNKIINTNRSYITKQIKIEIQKYSDRQNAIKKALQDDVTKLPIEAALQEDLKKLENEPTKAIYIRFTDDLSTETIEQQRNLAQLIKKCLPNNNIYKINARTFAIILPDDSDIQEISSLLQKELWSHNVNICTLDNVPADKIIQFWDIGINHAYNKKIDIHPLSGTDVLKPAKNTEQIKNEIEELIRCFKKKSELLKVKKGLEKQLRETHDDIEKLTLQAKITNLKEDIHHLSWISPRFQPIIDVWNLRFAPINFQKIEPSTKQNEWYIINRSSVLWSRILRKVDACIEQNQSYFSSHASRKMEALFWVKPGVELFWVPLDVVFDVADKNWLHNDLTLAIIDGVVEQMKDQPGYDFSVNINARDLYDEHFSENVKEIFDNHNFTEYDRLAIEIVEWKLALKQNFNPKDPDNLKSSWGRATNNLYQLAKLGCAIAMDDYGTEESNLTRFLDLDDGTHEIISSRFIFIKIDIKFVTGVASNIKKQKSITNTIHLAQQKWWDNWPNHVVVEWVENRKDVQWLMNQWLRLFQWYYFARPEQQSCFANNRERHCENCKNILFCKRPNKKTSETDVLSSQDTKTL